MASAKAAQGNFDVSERRCSDEHGLGSAEHEAALDRLDGKRIVFIGDVSVRWDCLAGLCLRLQLVCLALLGILRLISRIICRKLARRFAVSGAGVTRFWYGHNAGA